MAGVQAHSYKLVTAAREVLAGNRADALSLVRGKGLAQTQKLLQASQRDLERRLAKAVSSGGADTFTAQQLRATLAQVRHVVRDLKPGLQGVIVRAGGHAAELAADHTIEYLARADRAFRGVGAQPLALHEASMLDAATRGVNASILRRLASSGEPMVDADLEPHPAKMGILDRYGEATIGNFEETLQRGLIGRKSWVEMRADITRQSPFLQGAPAHWAARIVRTECLLGYNKAGNESVKEADDQLGDMCKILSATFDDRTAADSYAVHGQIRRPEEAFETWYGLMQHPPARPNDREIVVPHRISWPIPPYLAQKSNAEIAAVWAHEGHKQKMPSRPLVTTIPLSSFGKR